MRIIGYQEVRLTEHYADDIYTLRLNFHEYGRKTVYASLAPEPAVKVGDRVQAGEVIGAVGNSSLSETALGPHLHFAVLQDEEPIDPRDFLKS